MGPFLGVLIVLVQTCNGQRIYRNPRGDGFNSPNSPLNSGPRFPDTGFMPVRSSDFGVVTSDSGLLSPIVGHGPNELIFPDLRLGTHENGFGLLYQPGYNVQRESLGGRRRGAHRYRMATQYAGPSYDVRIPPARPHSRRTIRRLRPRIQRPRNSRQGREETRIIRQGRVGSRREIQRREWSSRERQGRDWSRRERQGREESRSRRDSPIQEGYVGAHGGLNGFPLMGGYGIGEAHSDGGVGAGLGNGIGTGSLEEFYRRRRLGINEDRRLYEMFATGPSPQSN